MGYMTELEESNAAGWSEEYNSQQGEDCPECEEELQVFDWAVAGCCPECGTDLDEAPVDCGDWRAEDAALAF